MWCKHIHSRHYICFAEDIWGKGKFLHSWDGLCHYAISMFIHYFHWLMERSMGFYWHWGGLGCNVRLKYYKWKGVFTRNLVHFLRSTYVVRSTHWNDFYLKQKSFIGTQNMVDSRHREVIAKGQRSVNPYLGWTASFFMSRTDIIWQRHYCHTHVSFSPW